MLIAKDGADLQNSQAVVKDAHQEIFPGAIYDFEFVPLRRGSVRLEVANDALKSKITQLIEVQ